MLNLLVNPIAGGKQGKKMRKNLAAIEHRLKTANVPYTVFKTSARGDATALTRKIIAIKAVTTLITCSNAPTEITV